MENSTQEEGRDEVTTNEMMTPTANANAHVQANANSQPSQMVEPADTPSSRRRRATTLNADDEAEAGDEDEDEDDSDDEDDDEEDEDEDDDDDAPVFMSMPPRQANANANANQQVRGMASVVYGGYASRYSRGPRHGTLLPCILFIYQFIYKIERAYPVIIYLAINIYLYLRVKTNFFYTIYYCSVTRPHWSPSWCGHQLDVLLWQVALPPGPCLHSPGVPRSTQHATHQPSNTILLTLV